MCDCKQNRFDLYTVIYWPQPSRFVPVAIGLHMGKKTKCDMATLKVVEVRRGLL